jgi:hypothetical protein
VLTAITGRDTRKSKLPRDDEATHSLGSRPRPLAAKAAIGTNSRLPGGATKARALADRDFGAGGVMGSAAKACRPPFKLSGRPAGPGLPSPG